MAQLADSEVFRAFASHAVIVLVKMMALGLMTSYYRITRKVFANLEDAAGQMKEGDPKKYIRTDQDVERVRRCHLNDIENIVPFIGVGLLYALSNPALSSALLHFRIFTASRLLHSVAYLTPLPQPSRALCFVVGYLVTVSMAFFTVQSLLYI